MSNNLDDLDETAPVGSTAFVSDLDDAVQETRLFLKDWVDREHVKNGGRHKFTSGNTAARLTIGTNDAENGSIYINTETGAIDAVIASAWVTTNKASRSPIHFVGSVLTGGLTRYLGTVIGAADLDARLPCPYKGTIKNLYVELNVAPGLGQTVVCTLMLNGVAQTLTCTITGAATLTGSDITHSVTIAAGDTISLRVVTSGSVPTTTIKSVVEHLETP